MNNKKFTAIGCLLFLYLSAWPQKGVVVTVKQDKISFKYATDPNDTFHIIITILNNSDRSIQIPLGDCNEYDVSILRRGRISAFVDGNLAKRPKQVIAPKSSASINLVTSKYGYSRGKQTIRFSPFITDLTNKERIDAISNKVRLKIE